MCNLIYDIYNFILNGIRATIYIQFILSLVLVEYHYTENIKIYRPTDLIIDFSTMSIIIITPKKCRT